MTEREPDAKAELETGRTLHRQGRLEEAERFYRTAIARDGCLDAKEGLGVLCLQQGRREEAVRWLGEAASEAPANSDFVENLAVALLEAGRPDEAVAAFERAIAAAPGSVENRRRLGDLFLQLGRQGRARAVFAEAVGRDPQLHELCRDVSGMADEAERCRAILENCGHILARYPHDAEVHYRKACALLSLGRTAEARRAAEQALAIDATVPTYYHVLIHTGAPQDNAAAVAALEQLAAQESLLDDLDRATLHFLLAKAYDDRKRTAEAFAHLQKANTLKRGLIAYDEAREIARLEAIAAAFGPARLAVPHGSGCPSELPVFVVGMPRSGTTLVEQILASHPEGYGAGEVTYLGDLVAVLMDYPAGIAGAGNLSRLGENYVARLAAHAPAAKRIVDKLPYNFLHIGLIRLALPGARIIHVGRDALDTCFSCYEQNFAGEVGFAYDLSELGRYYRAYEALMAHWRAVLPEGAMLEVQYESLVNDLGATARRMVEYCGLGWDARCLDFHKNPRAVATASLAQVRRPLYRSAIGRAGAYGAYLEPLRRALGLE